jgi:hypothetical protein
MIRSPPLPRSPAVTRNSPAKLTTVLAGLLLCAAGGLALADPHDSGGSRDRSTRGGDSWQRSDDRYEARRAA